MTRADDLRAELRDVKIRLAAAEKCNAAADFMRASLADCESGDFLCSDSSDAQGYDAARAAWEATR